MRYLKIALVILAFLVLGCNYEAVQPLETSKNINTYQKVVSARAEIDFRVVSFPITWELSTLILRLAKIQHKILSHREVGIDYLFLHLLQTKIE